MLNIGAKVTINFVKLAWFDIKISYRRSVIGPFWIALNTMFFVGLVAFVYSFLFKTDVGSFLPWVACGFVSWNFIALSLNEGCFVFINNRENLLNLNVPFPLYAVKSAAKITMIVSHQLLFLIPFYVWKPEYLTLQILLLPLVLVIFFVNSVLINIIVGIFGMKYRDVNGIVSNLILLFFIVTPIFWPKELIGRVFILDANPVYHFVQLMRNAMLGHSQEWQNVVGVFIVTILLACAAKVLVAKERNKLTGYL